MEIKIANIRIPVDKKADLKQWVIKRYHLQAGHVEQFRIIRSSVDARNKKKIVYDYQVYVRLSKPYPHLLKQADVFPYQPPVMPEYMPWKHFHAPVVVGFGPAGEGYVRFTAFGSHEKTEEALDRIASWSKQK